MYRYVALSWNVEDKDQSEHAERFSRALTSSSRDWKSVYEASGLKVYHATHPGGAFRAYVLKHDTGVIVGRVFSKGSNEHISRSVTEFDYRESNAISRSNGRHLVENYWGQYVAFLSGREHNHRHILRDPSGGMHCFMTKKLGVHIILSDVDDYTYLNSVPSSIDWHHITAFFMHMTLVTNTTGFKDVTQVYAGECVKLVGDEKPSRSFYWNPVNVYEADSVESVEEARLLLRNTIVDCINAWRSCYDGIIHELSGGLDSSIVAACLGKSEDPGGILCFHYFTKMTEGDERVYARIAAESAGCEFVEQLASTSEVSLENQLSRKRVATPAVQSFRPKPELLQERLAKERGVGAMFSGQGGDHLFQEGAYKTIATDFFLRHGVTKKLAGIMIDTSHLTGESFWSVLSTIISHGILRKSYNPYSVLEVPSILTGSAVTSLQPSMYTHPWVEHATHLPPTKIEHVFSVVDSQAFYQLPRTYAEQIHPLISQPIIELSLQIPSHVLSYRGRSRGLLRDAFRDDVPEKIINRYTKGGTTSYFNQMLVDGIDYIRELLLDGALVREKIVDRKKLEDSLSEEQLLLGEQRRAVLNAVRAETWLDNWRGLKQRTAA